MTTKLMAMAALIILLTGLTAYADFDLGGDSAESTEEFNARIAASRPPKCNDLYIVQQKQLIEARKTRCLMEKMSGQQVSQECYNPDQDQDQE